MKWFKELIEDVKGSIKDGRGAVLTSDQEVPFAPPEDDAPSRYRVGEVVWAKVGTTKGLGEISSRGVVVAIIYHDDQEPEYWVSIISNRPITTERFAESQLSVT